MLVNQLLNKNQFIIFHDNKTHFQSYNSHIATYDRTTKKLYLSAMWDYSKTTLKHLYYFIENYTSGALTKSLYLFKNNKKSIEKALKNGDIGVLKNEK